MRRTTEVRAAHERLKKTSGIWDRYDGRWLSFTRDDFEDMRTVISAWSAGHPADEDEPAYADWLLRSGFREEPTRAGTVNYVHDLPKLGMDKEFFLRFVCGLWGRAENWTVEVAGVYSDDAPDTLPGQTYGTTLLYEQDFTRGQVRELCRSLRAPIPVTP